MTKCEHDYEHPRRVGRASYLCRLCGADISLTVILIAAAEEEHERLRQVRKDNQGLGVPGRLPPAPLQPETSSTYDASGVKMA